MIQSYWRRISGVHLQEDGATACVWLAHDRHTDVVHLYDCAVFRREVLAVIAEGLSARGRWIPVAWRKEDKALADDLLERGVNIISEPCEDNDGFTEIITRDLWGRMRSGRLKVDKRLSEWMDEFKDFRRHEQKVPETGFPLMAATRHAIAMHDAWARAESPPSAMGANHPNLTVV